MSTVSTQDKSERLMSTATYSFLNSTYETNSNATVDEYVQLVFQNFQYVNLAVCFTMGLIAFSTNLLTIVAIASFEYLRTCTNYLIAYLAFADMIAGITSMFLVANYLIPMSDYMWTRMCAIELSFSWSAIGMNASAILGISLDRFIYIAFPLRYYFIVTKRVTVTYISLFVVGLIGMLARMNCCGYYYIPDPICTGAVFNYFGLGTILFLVTSILIVPPNIAIAYIAYKQKKAIARGQVFEVNTQQNKITKMLAMVLGIYFCCCIPQFAVLAILSFFPGATYDRIIERVTSWIWWVNSWSNPPIYAWKNKAFNKAFRSLLGMKSATVNPALQ